MKVHVYDTYATAQNGSTIHFDVLVPAEVPADTAFRFAQQWLSTAGHSNATLEQSRCNFCHAENANPAMLRDIERDGFHILELEGC
ncbi:MAG: DUF2024 family protein [Deltaproteobacteria bacterium]|nr:DUF2024 family protein [Deltaproteobacteria bacterium]